MYAFKLKTNYKECLINITDKIRMYTNDNRFKSGILTIFTPHTTAAVTINENSDPDVKTDIIYFLNKYIPSLKEFKHFEGNSDAHIKSTLVGCSETIIIENSQLILGTWQSIYFCEFDGPRERKVYLKFIGD